MKVFGLVFLALGILAACSNKPCREVNMEGVPEEFRSGQITRHMLVYKYDGTKQCSEGTEISLDTMSKQLQNIKIFSMSKRNDGMIRVQVCGSQNGSANVYEIEQKDFEKAKSFGFQEWKFTN